MMPDSFRFLQPAHSLTGGRVALLRTARSPSPVALQAPAIEPAGVETPGQAAPAPVGSPISREQFLKEARAL